MTDKKKKKRTLENVATGVSATEVVSRYGSANAEYIKGYTGVDNEAGRKLHRGLKDIADYNLDSNNPDKTIKQQAGFSAEIAKTSNDNAENIISQNDIQISRTEDVPGYGANHPVYDHVELKDGVVIEGSGSQMKFVNDSSRLCDQIAKGDLSRYQKGKIDLPTEQVEEAKAHCLKQAEKLKEQAERLECDGKHELAAQKRGQAENYEELVENIRDSGMTTEKAVSYREHPKRATVKDITVTSHRAGLEVAKGGALIGGCIALVQNAVAVCQDNKEIEVALTDTATSTAKAAGTAYVTGFTGSAIKGVMQQSKRTAVKAISKTNLPAMIAVAVLEAGKSIKQYVSGDIDEVQLAEQLGEKGTGIMAGSFGATVGQLAIPVPVVGAVLGGMIGYALSSIFYTKALGAFKSKNVAEERYAEMKELCEEARTKIAVYKAEMITEFEDNFDANQSFYEGLFRELDNAVDAGDIKKFEQGVKRFSKRLDVVFRYGTFNEFDEAMASDRDIII